VTSAEGEGGSSFHVRPQNQLAGIEGVAGVHLLVAGNEQAVPGILDAAGIRATRGPDGR
jgi:hypothetical protein